MTTTHQPKLLSQGTYGCIFRPGVDCRGNPFKTKKFITKIQRKESISDKEVETANIIKTIPHFDDHFAPILESCKVDIAKIDADEIAKCEFIDTKNPKNEYNTNKIQYVGENTLEDYFYYLFSAKSAKKKKNIEKLATTHIELLASLEKMAEKGLVHNDIKENNIVCEKSGNPILIDFGLSINSRRIETAAADTAEKRAANYAKEDTFFLYDTTYDYWCFDICVLSFMFEGGKSKTQSTVTDAQIEMLVKDFTEPKESRFIKTLFSQEHRAKLIEYLRKFKDKKWALLFDDLIGRKYTWDNYALAVTYYTMMQDLSILEMPILMPYADYLKTIITATPEERPSLADSIRDIGTIFSKTILKQTLAKTRVRKQPPKNQRVLNTKLNQLEGDAKLARKQPPP